MVVLKLYCGVSFFRKETWESYRIRKIRSIYYELSRYQIEHHCNVSPVPPAVAILRSVGYPGPPRPRCEHEHYMPI